MKSTDIDSLMSQVEAAGKIVGTKGRSNLTRNLRTSSRIFTLPPMVLILREIMDGEHKTYRIPGFLFEYHSDGAFSKRLTIYKQNSVGVVGSYHIPTSRRKPVLEVSYSSLNGMNSMCIGDSDAAFTALSLFKQYAGSGWYEKSEWAKQMERAIAAERECHENERRGGNIELITITPSTYGGMPLSDYEMVGLEGSGPTASEARQSLQYWAKRNGCCVVVGIDDVVERGCGSGFFTAGKKTKHTIMGTGLKI